MELQEYLVNVKYLMENTDPSSTIYGMLLGLFMLITGFSLMFAGISTDKTNRRGK